MCAAMFSKPQWSYLKHIYYSIYSRFDLIVLKKVEKTSWINISKINAGTFLFDCLDRWLSLTMVLVLCCVSSLWGPTAMKPSMNAQLPTVWERSTPVPSSLCWRVRFNYYLLSFWFYLSNFTWQSGSIYSPFRLRDFSVKLRLVNQPFANHVSWWLETGESSAHVICLAKTLEIKADADVA